MTRIHIEPRKETPEARARVPKLIEIGCTDDEVEQLKWTHLDNPAVVSYLTFIRDEVRRLRDKYGLPNYAAAARYRREHREELIDAGDIEEPDPWRRMGYF